MGLCEHLDLQSNDPADLVTTCNTIYGLLLQHQRDAKFKEQLKQGETQGCTARTARTRKCTHILKHQYDNAMYDKTSLISPPTEVHRARIDLQAADKERLKLEARLEAKEREIGGLMNKARAGDDARKEDVSRARREAEELQKRLLGADRRVVQMQHEMKRKEREFERLQERLTHYLADKKRSEKAALDMAGELTQGVGGSSAPVARGARSDEGLKAVVAAYEGKQAELMRENKDLRATLTTLQAEFKEALNAAVARREADAVAGPVVDEAFLSAVPHMSADELKAELATRLKALQRRLANLSWRPGTEGATGSVAEQRMAADLAIARSVIVDQEALISGVLGALRGAQATAETQHQAEARALVQRYQGQLAAAETELQRKLADAEHRVEQEAARLRAEAAEELAEVTAARDEALARAAEAEAALAQADYESAHALEQAARARDAAVAEAVAEERLKAETEMVQMAEQSSELAMALKKEQAALRAETGALRERLVAMKAAADQAVAEKEESLASVEAQVQAAEARARMQVTDEYDALLSTQRQAVEDLRMRLAEAADRAAADKATAIAELEATHAAALAALQLEHREAIRAADQAAADLSAQLAEAEAALSAAQGRLSREEVLGAERNAALATAEAEVAALRRKLSQAEAALEAARSDADARAAHVGQERDAELAALRRKIQTDRATLLAKAEADFAEEREELVRKAAELQKALNAEQAAVAAREQQLRSQSKHAGHAEEAAMQYENMTKHYKELMGKYAPGLGAGIFLERAVGRRAAELAGVNSNAPATAAVRGRRG